MKNTKRNLGILIALLLSINGLAQQKTVIGNVTAFKTIALNNIKVSSKKTKNNTLTDKNGNFSIKCTDDDVLTFDSECFQKLKIKLKNENDSIKVNLFFNDSKKNRELCVLNGHTTQEILAYALSNLPNQAKDYSKYLSMFDLIKTECPHVQVLNGEIMVQTPNSISNNKPALLVLDGVYVNDISTIQPSSVISIDVVKGAEASMYGLQGSSGVLVIKTFGKKRD